MDVNFSSFKWQFTLVYLDDAIFFSKSLKGHLDEVSAILRMLKTAAITLKLCKCSFFTESVYYLGYVISKGKQQVEKKTCAAVEGLVCHTPRPSTK